MKQRTSPRGGMSGFSLFEVAVSVSIFGTIVLVVACLLAATNGVTRRSHADLMAAQKNRQALELISGVLRSASSTSITGFDDEGIATAPVFQPVLGMSGGALSLGETSTVQWQSGGSYAGVGTSGDVVMTKGGVTTTLASRVAPGGFTVTQSGSALKVRLVTFHPIDGGGVSYATGDATVALRN